MLNLLTLQVRAMQEALAKMKEEEERLQREEEERQKAIEAARLAKEEKVRTGKWLVTS